jgi:hypothetical protein
MRIEYPPKKKVGSPLSSFDVGAVVRLDDQYFIVTDPRPTTPKAQDYMWLVNLATGRYCTSQAGALFMPTDVDLRINRVITEN